MPASPRFPCFFLLSLLLSAGCAIRPSPAATIERFPKSAARFDLTPAQVIGLHQRGLPLPVLQAIHEDRGKALRTDLTQQLVEREQKCHSEVVQQRTAEQLRARTNFDSSWPGCYGAWGPLPYRRPGVFMGWCFCCETLIPVANGVTDCFRSAQIPRSFA